MLQDIRFALFLLAELVAALQAIDPDTFKRQQTPHPPARQHGYHQATLY
ncbi:MAG: hypothetical protein O2972_01180 [Cyanobacteria bacterium]|nr:hypothetical protein [Cyanobacteriota bacterium]